MRVADERRRLELELARTVAQVAIEPAVQEDRRRRVDELDRELQRLRRLERWQTVWGKR